MSAAVTAAPIASSRGVGTLLITGAIGAKTSRAASSRRCVIWARIILMRSAGSGSPTGAARVIAVERAAQRGQVGVVDRSVGRFGGLAQIGKVHLDRFGAAGKAAVFEQWGRLGGRRHQLAGRKHIVNDAFYRARRSADYSAQKLCGVPGAPDDRAGELADAGPH